MKVSESNEIETIQTSLGKSRNMILKIQSRVTTSNKKFHNHPKLNFVTMHLLAV